MTREQTEVKGQLKQRPAPPNTRYHDQGRKWETRFGLKSTNKSSNIISLISPQRMWVIFLGEFTVCGLVTVCFTKKMHYVKDIALFLSQYLMISMTRVHINGPFVAFLAHYSCALLHQPYSLIIIKRRGYQNQIMQD